MRGLGLEVEHLEQIADGRLRPGDKLPSTAELQVAYECSDNPVKKAIGRLQAIGLLIGRQGRGVYVTDGRSGPGRPRIASAVVRLSRLHPITNSTKACRSSWCAGIPRMMRGSASGVSRTVPV